MDTYLLWPSVHYLHDLWLGNVPSHPQHRASYGRDRLYGITQISFAITLIGLTVGYIVISIHQFVINKRAFLNAQKILKETQVVSLQELIEKCKAEIIQTRSVFERVISYKTVHGCFMLASWLNIAGRVFITNPFRDFACYTTAVYKNVPSPHFTPGTNATVSFVPAVDPNYERTPWANKEVAWGIQLSFGPVVGGLLIAIAYGLFVQRIYRKRSSLVLVK